MSGIDRILAVQAFALSSIRPMTEGDIMKTCGAKVMPCSNRTISGGSGSTTLRPQDRHCKAELKEERR